MNSTNTLQALFKNERDKFLSKLESYVLLDIGTIEEIDERGRARVVSSTFMDNKPIIYNNAEVIFPGNANGTFAASGRNMACLIFIPRSCMPDVSDLVLHIGAASYNKDGVKAMPIGNGVANTVKLYYSDGGNLALLAKTYNINFENNTIVLQTEDGKTSASLDGQGCLHMFYQSDTGSYFVDITSEGVVHEYTSQDEEVIWTDKINSDGSRTFVQKDNHDNVLSSVTIGADGSLSVTSKADISVSTEGDASVTAEGDIDVSTEDGDVSVDASSIKLNGSGRHLVAYEDLKNAMDILYAALTTTPIAGEGATQPSWAGLDPLTGIDISAAKIDNVVTGAAPTP